MSVVAISASYGAGGSRVGPLLANRLGVPFLDRAIPAAVAEALDVSLDDAAAHDECLSRSRLERLLSGFIGQDTGAPTAVPAQAGGSAEEFRRATEKVLCARAATGSGVILGRGGVILLREDLRVLRVRLDGPPRARVEQAMRIEGVDERTAERRRRRLDRTHEAYARHFYGVDLRDPALYHVVLDPTALGIETSVEMLVAAVGALGGRGDGSSPPGQRVAL